MFGKKVVVSNPDHLIFHCVTEDDQTYINKVLHMDEDVLVGVLNQFDVISISQLIAKLPVAKGHKIFDKFETTKQAIILRYLPSQCAARILSEKMNSTICERKALVTA